MRQLSIRARILAFALAGMLGMTATAQEPGEQDVRGRGQVTGTQRVAGTVTAVSADAVTVKAEDGTVYQVTATTNTRLMKGQGVPLKISDLKVGDGVTAAGIMDVPNKTLHAAFMFAVDAEQVKKMRENLGKTFIAGKVTAIDADNLKITVLRQDNVSQTIGLDEMTSFKRGGRGAPGMAMGMAAGAAPAESAPTEGGESITLADIKVGDNVAGPGAVKAGVFVPTQLNVGRERQGRGPRGTGAAKSSPAAGDGVAAPATPQQ